MVTFKKLVEDLKTIGIKNGDHIALGVSFSSIGSVENGAKTFIKALLSTVGKSGTIMIPTFTKSYPLILVDKKLVEPFSKEKTKAVTGYLSEVIRSYPEAVRSSHPTNSYAAIGAKARFLLDEHDHNSTGYSPYSKLANVNGKILIIGLGFNLIGIRHEAQFQAGLFDVFNIQRGALYENSEGNLKTFIRKDWGGCVTRLPLMKDEIQELIKLSFGKIGNASSFLVDANEVLPTMTELLLKHPEKYLCQKASCTWCRLIEKRLHLYSKLSVKKWFQRFDLTRNIIYLINEFKAKENNRIILLNFYRKKVIRFLFPKSGKYMRIIKNKIKLKKYRST